MDCMHTQEILSQAADRAPVEAELLQQAKDHCAECDECTRFVRGLTRLHRAPKPRMAPQALEALVKRARIEAERLEVAQAQQDVQAMGTPAGEAEAEAAALAALAELKQKEATKRPKSNWSKLSEMPLRQQAMVGSGLAAAIILVGVVSVAGMSYLLTPNGTQTASVDEAVFDSDQRGAGANIESAPTALSDTAESSAEDSADLSLPSENYVVFDGWVYRAAGPQSVNLSDLVVVGTLESDLGGGQVNPRTVWSAGTNLSILVQADDNELLGFDLVTRRIDNARYGLRSNAIPSYGQWPTLPAGILEPVNEDGSPTFDSTGTDDGGITTHPLAGTDAVDGYAIAPFTDGEDATEGNPNWTWWLPVPK